MKALGIDGNSYPFVPNAKKKTKNKSKLHERAINILKEVFPKASFSEEVSVKIERGVTLYIDIYIPVFGIAVEVDGKQHDEYTGFFHKNDKINFYKAQKRDRQKEEWCNINRIKLIRLKESYTDDEWRDKLRKAVK